MEHVAPRPQEPDLALPAVDLRALVRRAALPAAAAALAACALVALGGPLQAFADALARALAADPRWVALAALCELASFAGYVALVSLVGGGASARIGLRESAQVALGGAAATRLLPTGGAGGVALTVWPLRRSGKGTRAATDTLLALLALLYGVFLTAIAATGALVALGVGGTGAPPALTALPAAAAAAAVLLGLATAHPRGPGARLPIAGLRTGADLLGDAVRHAAAHVRAADPRVLGAVAWWAFDAAVLWAMLQAFGSPPAFAVVAFAFLVGQAANTLPVPGAASGGIVGALLALGVAADLALVSVLAYRAVAIWLPAPFGLVALGGLRRTVARWGAEDERRHG